MQEYQVWVKLERTSWCQVDVEADSPEDAEKLVEERFWDFYDSDDYESESDSTVMGVAPHDSKCLCYRVDCVVESPVPAERRYQAYCYLKRKTGCDWKGEQTADPTAADREGRQHRDAVHAQQHAGQLCR